MKGAEQAPYPCDLHSHTVLSDGNDTSFELIEHAVARGLKVLAVTDHDVLPLAGTQLPDGRMQDMFNYARGRGLCLLPGVEFSCEATVEDVHIVGLGCDWESPELRREVELISQSKANTYVTLLERLTRRGYPMELDEVLNFGGHPVLLSQLQKKRIFDLMAAKGYVPSWSDAKLLVRDDPYLNVEREKPAAKHIIETLHRAGGIAILAHPYLIDARVCCQGARLDRWEFIDRLTGYGLDGIEVRYPYDKTTCKDPRPREEIWGEIESKAAGRLIVSAGSDYHADVKKGVPNQRDLGECGLSMEEFLRAAPFERLCRAAMEA